MNDFIILRFVVQILFKARKKIAIESIPFLHNSIRNEFSKDILIGQRKIGFKVHVYRMTNYF